MTWSALAKPPAMNLTPVYVPPLRAPIAPILPPTPVTFGDATCQDSGNYIPVTVCRRPYGRQAYGRGPYGRCAIVGGCDWAPPGVPPAACDPLWTPVEEAA